MSASEARRHVRDSGFWRRYSRRRYATLFYTLLLMLVALPVFVTFGFPKVLLKILIAFCLLAAVMPNASKGQRTAFFATVVGIVALRFIAEQDSVPIDFGPVLALYGCIGLLAAAGTFRFVVQSPRVDSETVYAALSTYVLGGIFFGIIYSAIEFMQPGSFSGPDPFTDAAAIYYSFVTMATLGYGDFLPKSELARGIATFEVIGGQLYLAVMVARLIGAFDFNKKG
jgi:hypothetical protein